MRACIRSRCARRARFSVVKWANTAAVLRQKASASIPVPGSARRSMKSHNDTASRRPERSHLWVIARSVAARRLPAASLLEQLKQLVLVGTHIVTRDLVADEAL